MKLGNWIAAVWTFLGASLFFVAGANTLKWQTETIYLAVGLSWDWINFLGGVAASLVAFIRYARLDRYAPLEKALVVIFGGYAILCLVIGDEAHWLYRFFIPIFILLLSVVTFVAKRVSFNSSF